MSSLRAIAKFAAVLSLIVVPTACSSTPKTQTSGGAHFEIVNFPTAPPELKCGDIGKQINVAVNQTGTDPKLIVDGSDGATVQCSFDDNNYSVTVSNQYGYLSAGGTFQNAQKTSVDAHVILGFPGSNYKSPTGTPCTITFTDKQDNTLTGYVSCNELDNTAISTECAMNQSTNGQPSNSFFKFKDCNP